MYKLTFPNESSVIWAAHISTLHDYVYRAKVTEYDIVFVPNSW
jgi:hypothetical protein